MSNYVKATNFATKDTLPSGNAGKIVKGTEIDDEFNAIASAISSKADTASPSFTGTPAAPTAASGTNTTQIATTAFVKSAVDTGDALKADKTTTITAGTGLTGGGDLSANRTLAIANSGVTAGTYGSSSAVAQLVVNALGQITSASNVSLATQLSIGGNNSVSSGANFSVTTRGTGTILLVGIAAFESRFGQHGVGTVNVNKASTSLASGNARFAEANGIFNGDHAIAIAVFSGTANTTYTDFNITASITSGSGALTEIKYFYIAI